MIQTLKKGGRNSTQTVFTYRPASLHCAWQHHGGFLYCSISRSLFPCHLFECEQCPNIKKLSAPYWHLLGWRWPRVWSVTEADSWQEQQLLYSRLYYINLLLQI